MNNSMTRFVIARGPNPNPDRDDFWGGKRYSPFSQARLYDTHQEAEKSLDEGDCVIEVRFTLGAAH